MQVAKQAVKKAIANAQREDSSHSTRAFTILKEREQIISERSIIQKPWIFRNFKTRFMLSTYQGVFLYIHVLLTCSFNVKGHTTRR